MTQFIKPPAFLGDHAKFHHVGIAIKKMDDNLSRVKVHDPLQRVYVAFVDLYGCPVEFVEPASEDSPVQKILERGASTYHVCFTVPDIHQAIQNAKQYDCACIAQPVGAAAFQGRKIAWLRSKDYGIIELLEDT